MGNGVLLVLLGWLLSEVSHRFRIGHERRVAMGQALSELLWIHFSLLALAADLKEVVNHSKAPREVQIRFRALVEGQIPDVAELPKRYTEAVTTLGGVSPALAFRLRALGAIPAFLNQVADLSALNGVVPGVWPVLEEGLVGPLKLGLERVMLEAAWRHGLMTWWDVRQLLKKPVALPKEFIDRIIS
jgi:hypothetical protein